MTASWLVDDWTPRLSPNGSVTYAAISSASCFLTAFILRFASRVSKKVTEQGVEMLNPLPSDREWVSDDDDPPPLQSGRVANTNNTGLTNGKQPIQNNYTSINIRQQSTGRPRVGSNTAKTRGASGSLRYAPNRRRNPPKPSPQKNSSAQSHRRKVREESGEK